MNIGNQTVTIVRQEPDRFGDTRETGETVTVTGCFVQPTSGSESNETGVAVVQTFRIYGPEALGSARAQDKVSVDGWLVGNTTGDVQLGVQGNPNVWPNKQGLVDHVELDARFHSGGASQGWQNR